MDKEKVSDWLGIADLIRPMHTNNPKLVSVAKILLSHENPNNITKKNAENGENLYNEVEKDYQKAVNSGNTEDAQRFVDEAAKKAMPDSKIVDEYGKLLPVFHGTTEQFDEFDRTKGRANMDIQGIFFSPWELDAKGYGPNVRRFYLNITNPASFSKALAALRKFQGQDSAGVKAREYLIEQGYDGVNNDNEEYIAFYPNQIKSADAVTYDNDGNIIPLDRRFNEKKNSIRFREGDVFKDNDFGKVNPKDIKYIRFEPEADGGINGVGLDITMKDGHTYHAFVGCDLLKN